MIRDGPVLHHTDLARLKAFAEKSTQHVDYVNVSFCRNAEDLHACRRQLAKCAQSFKLCAQVILFVCPTDVSKVESRRDSCHIQAMRSKVPMRLFASVS